MRETRRTAPRVAPPATPADGAAGARPLGLARLWWAAALPLLLLGLLTAAVAVRLGPLLSADRAVRDAAAAASDSAGVLDGPMRAIADLGAPLPGALALVPVVVWVLLRGCGAPRARWLRVLTAISSIAFVGVVVIAGKAAVGRPGPDGTAPGDGRWGWYPSGHTATSAMCFGAAALLAGYVAPGAARRARRVAVAVCGAVGASLVWCGYHWLSDVVASWLLCGPVLFAAARLMGSRAPEHRPSRDGPVGPGAVDPGAPTSGPGAVTPVPAPVRRHRAAITRPASPRTAAARP